MPLSNERRRELYALKKNGTNVVPNMKPVVPTVVPMEPVVLVPTVVPDVLQDIVARLDKLEQVVSSLVPAVNALRRDVGLMKKQQKLNAPDYNPESW